MNNKFKIIYIEWCDAMVNSNSWMNFKEAKKWSETENWVVSEVGFLLKETKEYILIANKKSSYNEYNPEVGGIMKIPTTWIRKRINLTNYIV